MRTPRKGEVVVAGEAELLREALHRAREELIRRTNELAALEKVMSIK
jgi:hypothetical protein